MFHAFCELLQSIAFDLNMDYSESIHGSEPSGVPRSARYFEASLPRLPLDTRLSALRIDADTCARQGPGARRGVLWGGCRFMGLRSSPCILRWGVRGRK